jgi:hypothetical protein
VAPICSAADDVGGSVVLRGNVRRAPRPVLTRADAADEANLRFLVCVRGRWRLALACQ